MVDTLAQAKEIIWTNINQAITEVWPSIKIIFEQQELITKCMTKIEVHKTTLKTKPSEATYIIKVLNSNNREHLEEINISEKTTTIFENKKVLQKKNLINH